MTYPDGPLPGLAPEQEAMFEGAALAYARHRPGLPEAAVRLLAGTLRGRPSPVLLDLGTGTGQVPFALLSVGAGLTHIEAVDVSPQMLHQARQALQPVLGHCTLTLVHAAADAYEPLATLPGEPESGPDLITFCRSCHWMSGPAVLEMADRVATPGAAVAIMGDGSLWTHDADWTRALRELIQRYLGAERRAGARRSCAEPRRSYEEDLADSAFKDVTEHLFPVARAWTQQAVLGYLRTTSFAAPELFAERHQAFEDEAPGLLHAHAVDGSLVGSDVQGSARPASGGSAMSSEQRHTEPVDVHLILRRETADGPQVLLSRRAGQVYAASLWHLPSGHLDGPHEDVVTALIREALEETGVVIDPADVRAAVTVHHRSPGGASRTEHFFEVQRWKGEPEIAEPDVCDAMDWAPLTALPAQMVAYCRAGLDAYSAGERIRRGRARRAGCSGSTASRAAPGM